MHIKNKVITIMAYLYKQRLWNSILLQFKINWNMIQNKNFSLKTKSLNGHNNSFWRSQKHGLRFDFGTSFQVLLLVGNQYVEFEI